jgi:hypothetical protein
LDAKEESRAKQVQRRKKVAQELQLRKEIPNFTFSRLANRFAASLCRLKLNKRADQRRRRVALTGRPPARSIDVTCK